MVAYGPGVGSMLASNADRDRAVDVLRAGFAEGRLTQPEFEERVARVHQARTYDQLTELTCDLPVGPVGPWAFTGATMVPYRDRPVSYRDQEAAYTEPSFANLALTALVMFALAAIVTALTVYAHIHGSAFAPPPGPGSIHLQPYIQRVPMHPQHLP
jgi:hypothetical protein